MSNDFTRHAMIEYKRAWNDAIRTVTLGLAAECRTGSRLDRYTLDVVLHLLDGLKEDELDDEGINYETAEH